MPTNNNGNSKKDALSLVEQLCISGGSSCKTFMDCVRTLIEDGAREKQNQTYEYMEILDKQGIRTTEALSQLITEVGREGFYNVSNQNKTDIIEKLASNEWGNNVVNISAKSNFQKWLICKTPEQYWETEDEKNRSWYSSRYTAWLFIVRKCIDSRINGRELQKKMEKLEKNIDTYKQQSKIQMDEINSLHEIIEKNNIELDMCELCNRQMTEEDKDDMGNPLTKCGNKICLGCIKKIQPTKNTTPTENNTEILCPTASIPFSYFKTKCPYCRCDSCLPKFNEYDDLVVATMKSLISWSHKGNTELKPSFVRSCNVMYKICGRSYLPTNVRLLR